MSNTQKTPPDATQCAIASVERITQLISEMGFNMGGVRTRAIAVGRALIDGTEQGVIVEITPEGQARILAIAPYPGMTVQDLSIDIEEMTTAGKAATEEMEEAMAAMPEDPDLAG